MIKPHREKSYGERREVAGGSTGIMGPAAKASQEGEDSDCSQRASPLAKGSFLALTEMSATVLMV